MAIAELWEGASKQEYHDDPAVSQSAIKEFIKDPQFFKQKYIDKSIPPKEPTPSQVFGNAVEEVCFTGSLNAVTIPVEVMQRRNNADGSVTYAKAGAPYNAWVLEQQARHGEDVKFYKQEEFAMPMGPAAILQAEANLRAHDFAARLLWGETVRTVRIKWRDELTGLWCRCEIDILNLLGIIGDLKTSRKVDKYGFARIVAEYGYDIQSYYYREALQALAKHREHLPDTALARAIRPLLDRIADGENLLCCWVAVKNSPSYHAEVHPCSDQWYTIAAPIVRQAMFAIKRCYETGHWQTDTFGTITDMEPPTFAFNRIQELAATEE